MIEDEPVALRWRTAVQSHADPLFLRGAIAAGPLVAIAMTRAAGSGSVLAVEFAIAGLALICVALPDSHFGLLLVLLLAANWLVAVEDPTSPWAMGVAITLALLHTSMAAAGVAPIAASWSPAMRRRWTRRFVVVSVTSVPTWAATAAINRSDLGSSPALVAASLLTLAVAGLWVRHGNLNVDPPS